MKYAVNAGRISSFVKIVNFVGRAGSEYALPMAVIRKCRRKLSTAEPPSSVGGGIMPFSCVVVSAMTCGLYERAEINSLNLGVTSSTWFSGRRGR